VKEAIEEKGGAKEEEEEDQRPIAGMREFLEEQKKGGGEKEEVSLFSYHVVLPVTLFFLCGVSPLIYPCLSLFSSYSRLSFSNFPLFC